MAFFGCIADDFTGAGDAASFLAEGGLSVQLLNGVPAEEETGSEQSPAEGPQAVVIALKSRTAPAGEAVSESLRAAEYLLKLGVRQIYFKYCSTFDSTAEGNIGPVADALMERMCAPYSVLCPSLPVNGRTVSGGILYVNGVPLSESPMKDHPLTPMRESDLTKLMAPQSRFPARAVRREMLSGSAPSAEEGPCYLVPDYETDEDGKRIAEAFGDLPLLTGGSGLLKFLAARIKGESRGTGTVPPDGTPGRAVLLAGSCSAATLAQIGKYLKDGHPGLRIDPARVLDGTQTAENVFEFVRKHTTDTESVLVYSSDSPEKVRESQAAGAEKVSAALEGLTAEIAVRAVKDGFRRIVTAGGETSGAVMKALGYDAFWTSGSVAPGVPVMTPVQEPGVRLVLKSGNFGQEDFFERALRATGTEEDTELSAKLSDACFAARSLFERGKTSGSSANMSFRHGNVVWISASGTCFGTLVPSDFTPVAMDGTVLGARKPSKELPLHMACYEKSEKTGAVIHTHSTYSVLWSFVPSENEADCIPPHTPYLRMKLGSVGLVPYEKPGSEALFSAFRARAGLSDGYLLKNHGPVVPGKTVMDAFFCIEELEESARIAWELWRAGL